MTLLVSATDRTRAAYHAASDTYDHPALSFWSHFGRTTIANLRLAAGARVLDVCCGSGASALPAAETVGKDGQVLGIDLAPGLINLARSKARARRIANAQFEVQDFHEFRTEQRYDAVVCVMGIFFFDDMNAAAARLWEHVAPRGRLAVTTWGPRVFEPANTIFWNAVREVRPELYKGFNPWDRISEPAAVADILRAGGAARVDIQVVSRSHPLFSPADWWAIVMGSGYRGIVNLLTPAERATVQRRMMLELSSEHIDEIETNAIYAVAS